MSRLTDFIPRRGMIIDFNLDPTKGSETGKTRPCIVVTNDIYNQKLPVIQVIPITAWSEKKARVVTNIIINPNQKNGLDKKSIADCLQTRPLDYASRYIRSRGMVSKKAIAEIDEALKIIFSLS